MIFIYSPSENIKRLEYIATHIFNSILNIDFSITKDKDFFLKQTTACVNYSNEDLNHGLSIIPQGLLFEKGIREIKELKISRWNGYFCFFCNIKGDIPFDIFSASFYLLTLYEEYFPKQLDEHGRFKLNESFTFLNGFLETPLIDRWVYQLKNELINKYPETIFKKRIFKFISTIDVDYPYLYLKKGIIRSVGGVIKDLLQGKFLNIKTRINVTFLKKPDPYMEAILWIDQVHKSMEKSYYLFVLMKDRGKYGRKTFYPLNEYYKHLKQTDLAIIGLHPSYNSYHNLKQLIKEKKKLEKALKKGEISASRQHYLQMNVPDTFHHLESAGIRDDFTVAFSQSPGFRSGTALPYYFYDVVKDEVGKVLLHPTIIMDSCLITHQSLCPELALEKIKHLIDECKRSGGDFVSLWHNSNLTGNSNNNSWINVFTEMLRYAIMMENEKENDDL